MTKNSNQGGVTVKAGKLVPAGMDTTRKTVPQNHTTFPLPKVVATQKLIQGVIYFFSND